MSQRGAQGTVGHICRATCAYVSGWPLPSLMVSQAPHFLMVSLAPRSLHTRFLLFGILSAPHSPPALPGWHLLILASHPFCQEALSDLVGLS